MTGVVCWVVIFLLIVSTLAPSRTCHTEYGIFIPPVLVNLFEVEKRFMCVSVGLFVCDLSHFKMAYIQHC